VNSFYKTNQEHTNSQTSYLSIVIILAVIVALARCSVEGRPPRQVLYSHERNGALHSQAAEQQIFQYCLAQAILHHVPADRVDINSGVVNKPAEVLGLQLQGHDKTEAPQSLGQLRNRVVI